MFNIQAVLVPHDAREPCQFVISAGEWRFGMLTDVGQITPHLLREFAALDALVLEFNHDAALLAGSVYPSFLRERIGGPYGHLSNLQAADMLVRLDVSRLRTSVDVEHALQALRLSLIARWGSPAHGVAPAGGGRRPRPCRAGVTCARQRLFAANTPWERVRFTRGLEHERAFNVIDTQTSVRIARPINCFNG